MQEHSIPTVWSTDGHSQHHVQETVATAPDGGRFRVTRIGEGRGLPVVMLPGMFDNRRLYLWPGGGGLAETLADAGFDAWIVERRRTGGVAATAGVRAGWEEMVRVDLPTAQGLVAAHNGCPAFWVGHSFGGVALARAAAETMQQSQIAGLVLFNTAVDVPLLANPIVTATVRSRMWGGAFPARRFRLGPEDEPVAALEDAISWGAAERARGQLSAALSAVDVPILAFTAPRDVIAPATRCDRLTQPSVGRDLRVQSLARRHGFARNHNHDTSLLHPVAPTDVFPFLRAWLATRTGEVTLANTTTADAAGRYRTHNTTELDAPPEKVFQFLSRHWDTLWPVRQRRVRDGVDPAEPDGLRSVRAQRVLGIWPIQEEIVTYRPPRLIEYRTIRGPIRNHLGRIELTEGIGGGTLLDYTIAFDAPPWLPGRLLAAAIDTNWRSWSLPRLRHHMAAIP